MLAILASAMIRFDWSPRPVPLYALPQCAEQVGVLPNSDDLTDEQWAEFKHCINHRGYD